jgi:hypothetical protein
VRLLWSMLKRSAITMMSIWMATNVCEVEKNYIWHFASYMRLDRG